MPRFLPVLFLLLSGIASAQVSDWQELQKHVHKQVTVQTQSGQVSGRLVRVEDERLFIEQDGSPAPIQRASVRAVSAHKSRHTAAWIAGMSAAGLAAGGAIGFRQFDDAINSSQKITGTALAGAGLGAAAGFGISRIGKTERVVYTSEEH